MSLILLGLAALTATGTSARAYWTAPGSGTGQADSGSLNVPTNLAASATIGSRTVNLTWTGSSLSTGAAAQGYYLTRINNSDSSTTAACGSSPTNLKPAPTCADSAVPDGTFHYTVTAVFNSWTATSLSSNNVTVRTASRLAFTTAPSVTGISETALVTQPVVTVQDAAGVTITTDTSSVTLTLTTPGGATLTCAPNSQPAAAGVASFAGCKIDKMGTYSLTATDGSLAPATSSSVTISAGAPYKLAITSIAVSGTASATANLGPITVQRQDAFGNPASPATSQPVTLASDSSGATVFAATLNGVSTVSVTIPSGQSSSTFYYGDTKAATPIVTASGGVLGSTTQLETITAAAAANLAFTSAPVSGSASSDANLGPITVQRQDSFGNPVTSGTAMTVTLASNSTGAKVFATSQSGTSVTSVVIPSGAASATFHYGDTTAGSPTITATGSLTSATQIETITVGAASKLAFDQQPSNAVAGVVISPSPTVEILDQFDNLTSSTASVTMSIGTNPSAGTLSGTTTASAVGGVATFSGLSINTAGTGYTLTATSGALPAATSTSFNITAAPGGCTSGSSTVTATADSYLMQASPNKNNGSSSDLFINPTSGAAMRGVVKFTLPALDAGCTVTAATLRLRNHGGTGRAIDVYLADRVWAEGTVTWNNVLPTGTAVTSTAVSGWQTWSVQAQVIAQYTNNNGFVVRNQLESGGSGPIYYSRESANDPELIVTWG